MAILLLCGGTDGGGRDLTEDTAQSVLMEPLLWAWPMLDITRSMWAHSLSHKHLNMAAAAVLTPYSGPSPHKGSQEVGGT